MKFLFMLLINDIYMRKIKNKTELIELWVYFRCGINTCMRIQLF